MSRTFTELFQEWRQNDRLSALEARGRGGVVAPETVDQLKDKVAIQATQISMLRALVGALANTLRDSLERPGSVDAAVLDARLDAAIEDALLPPEPAPTNVVTCKRCGKEVPSASTNMTALGPMCDRCP